MSNFTEARQRHQNMFPIKVAFYIVVLAVFAAFFILCIVPISQLLTETPPVGKD